jgi:CRISPR-associated exonuclease Cas4
MRAGLIPIEVKPSRTAAKPYAGDLLQLAAYCLLVEDTTGQAPPYGLLRYAHRTFRVPYTADLRAQLLKVIADMRNAQAAPHVARSHGEAQRCRACGFFDKCDDRLE